MELTPSNFMMMEDELVSKEYEIQNYKINPTFMEIKIKINILKVSCKMEGDLIKKKKI